MRPTTPNLKIANGAAGSGGMDPASPPQTPTSVSPVLFHHHLNHHKASSRLPPNIHPIGNNHQFSYVRTANRFAQLSPQSSSEEEDDEEEEEDDDEEHNDSDMESTETDLPRSSSEEEEDDEDEDDDDDVEEEEDVDDDDHITNAPPPAARKVLNVQPTANEVDDDDDDDDDDDSEEDEEDEDDSDSDEDMHEPQSVPHITHAPEPRTDRTTPVVANFTVEELSDFDPMDDNRVGVIPPTSFEYPESDRSRSRSRGAGSSTSDVSAPKNHPHLPHRPRPYPDLDINMMQHLQNLNCSGSDDGEEEDDLFDASDDAAHKEFVLAQRALKMRKRRSHGSSIGKRTHSERSDSDGKEDLPDTPWDAVGASARRLRRRVGDRRSLQFQDPPPERIEELEEPDSCEEGRGRLMRGFGMLFGDGETLARELPYYAMEIMEMDEDE
ncbi:hypothetical protein BN1708_001829, partial [Verticillium longisporum]